MPRRPEWVKCIKHTHEEKKTTSWCGREVSMEWAFVDLDHAAYSNLNQDRLIPCKKCVRAAIKALTMAEAA